MLTENISVERESRGMENESFFEPCLTNTGTQAEAKVHLACAKIDFSWFNKRKMVSASRKCFRRVVVIYRECVMRKLLESSPFPFKSPVHLAELYYDGRL